MVHDIHKAEFENSLDPNCGECGEKTVGGLGPDWLVDVLGAPSAAAFMQLTDPGRIPVGSDYVPFVQAQRLLLIFRYQLREANAIRVKYERLRLEAQGVI